MRRWHIFVLICIAIVVAVILFYEPKQEVLSLKDVGSGTQVESVTTTDPLPPPRPSVPTILGTATTSFKGSSEERTKNITVGAERVNGKVVQPGEEFSILAALEPLNEGYEYEYVIGATMSVKEPGGGLCQVSTTLFRAVLDAGLPVTERQPHRYVVGYYGAGLDATIYEPHPDFRFKNDTEHPITIQATIEGTEIRISLEGMDDGRIASTSEPTLYDREEKPPIRYMPTFELPPSEVFCTEVSREGVKSDVTYSVTYPDGRVVDTVFHSEYQAWPGVCYVGIGFFEMP